VLRGCIGLAASLLGGCYSQAQMARLCDEGSATGQACFQGTHRQFTATDGTVHDALGAMGDAARDAALSSAAHDLPCARASITVVSADSEGLPTVFDGCGQRVTYHIDPYEFVTPAGNRSVFGRRYTVVARIAIPPR
jgi:hypothetical protein